MRSCQFPHSLPAQGRNRGRPQKTFQKGFWIRHFCNERGDNPRDVTVPAGHQLQRSLNAAFPLHERGNPGFDNHLPDRSVSSSSARLAYLLFCHLWNFVCHVRGVITLV
ncbi:hypothetical protein CEXT_33461 [Caerostris extrusa]|uniref:Uncharacterized protein n=1 Tax=Caerostris extrusa TaxID=172846 RepID=A0AAV4USD4_CAEEX|nr:hypothetical protein CEXT_33461 [Caerostris extrusa]